MWDVHLPHTALDDVALGLPCRVACPVVRVGSNSTRRSWVPAESASGEETPVERSADVVVDVMEPAVLDRASSRRPQSPGRASNGARWELQVGPSGDFGERRIGHGVDKAAHLVLVRDEWVGRDPRQRLLHISGAARCVRQT